MTSTITIVDYDVGNVFSIARAIERVGARAELETSAERIATAERLLLPGVGAFGHCASNLRSARLEEPVRAFVATGRPFLGICVGMQLLFDHSTEFGNHSGLGLIAGSVEAISSNDGAGTRKIPHIGWSLLQLPNRLNGWEGSVLEGLESGRSSAYFVHSFDARPANDADRLAEVDYEGYPVCAAVRHGNVTGVQFHPEKSAAVGLAILEKLRQARLADPRAMRVLFNWYYHRPDLTRELLQLGARHELLFIDRHAPDGVEIPGATILYWGDFASPYALLDSARPDKVVFSDIESFPQLALNIAARNRGIPTYVLQHGVRGAFEFDLAPKSPHSVNLGPTSSWTAQFLAKSLHPGNLTALPALLKFVYERKRFELTTALHRNLFELRRADHYIDYSRINAGYFRERDGIPDERLSLIGFPGLDEFFQRTPNYRAQDYALLIDAPFLEANKFAGGRMSAEQKASYLRRIDALCAAKGLRLVVKLHPLSYGSKQPQLANGAYVQEADLPRLLGESRWVIAVHYSTLTAPTFLFKPYYAFSSGLVAEIPFVSADETHDLLRFDPYLIGKPSCPVSWPVLQDYLHTRDGKAGERLRAQVFELGLPQKMSR